MDPSEKLLREILREAERRNGKLPGSVIKQVRTLLGMNPRRIIFHHMQKTGGTSVRQVMREVFEHFGELSPILRKPNGTWVGPPGRVAAAQAWGGHTSFGIHQVLPGRDVPYFTVLRDPIDREVSRYRHRSKEREKGIAPEATHRPSWSTVHQLSGVPEDFLPHVGPAQVEHALENLRNHYLYVGDTSRMEELGVWLKTEQGWPIRLPLPHVNKAKLEGEATEEERQKLAELPMVKLDQMLYDEVQKRGPRPQDW